MISREELQLIISGGVSSAGTAIESVAGRRLTRTELDELGRVFALVVNMVADRCAVKAPPPPPVAPARVRAQHFAPILTQEIRPVTDEDIRKATVAGLSPLPKPKL